MIKTPSMTKLMTPSQMRISLADDSLINDISHYCDPNFMCRLWADTESVWLGLVDIVNMDASDIEREEISRICMAVNLSREKLPHRRDFADDLLVKLRKKLGVCVM